MDKGAKVLELCHIHKSFRSGQGELKVIQDVSLQVCSGEIIALLGPSGCGKTTLVNIISGLLEPDGGELWYEADLRLAYVFQEPRLLPWRTVEANISFVQENFLRASEARTVRDHLLQKTELMKYKDVYPGQISGGMKQKLEIARALSIQPRLLLMDEPFKSLDLALKYDLRELILETQAKEEFAVLFVTHDPEEAVMLADRVIVLSHKPTRIHQDIVIDVPRDERGRKKVEISEYVDEILSFLLRRDH